jgi:curved DNA-binding protein CbpA
MGNNTSSRTEKYYNYLENSKNGSQMNIDINAIDPYEILGLTRKFTFEELKDAYRRTAKFVHPDKGGSEQLFNIATDCFRKLAHELKMREEKTHDELRKGSRDYWAQMPAAPQYTSERESNDSYKYAPDHVNSSSENHHDGGGGGGGGGNFTDRFNRAFEENRLKEDDGTHDGYGEKMAKSSKVREDFKIPQLMKKFNQNTFNKVFDTVTLSDSSEVVKYVEPEALPLAKSLQYTELGGASKGDFSSTSEGEARRTLQYTDYMKAYTTTRLVDPRAVQERKNFRNVDEYESERTNIMAAPETPEERAWRKKKEYEAQKAEEARLFRLNQRDTAAALHHERVNRLMINSRK